MLWTIPNVPPSFFSQEERMALDVLFDAIFPGEPEQGIPNTNKAGVVEFLDRLLSCDESIYSEIPQWREFYRTALSELTMHIDGDLSDLSRSQATEVLKQLESNELELLSISSLTFFNTLRRHCIQGCFSDPAWGGNQGMIMWRWLGYRRTAEDIYD